MRYLRPCEFYIYRNDRIKIRDLLIKELTLEQFSKMNDNDTVDPSNAIIMHSLDWCSVGMLLICYIMCFIVIPYKMNIWWQFNLANQSFLSDWWILYWQTLLYFTCIEQ